MAAYGIISQGRRLLCLAGDRPIWNQPKLNQSLEAVADAQNQSVSFIEKLLYRLLHLCILECSRKELGRAIRLVACAESSWEHDHLRLADSFLEYADRIQDIRCTHILEYLGDYVCSCPFKCPCAVILAVGSREYRYEYGWLGDLMAADMNIGSLIQSPIDLLLLSFCPGIGGEYRFKRFLPCTLCLGKADLFISVRECGILRHFSDYRIRNTKFPYLICRHFRDDIAKSRGKEISCIYIALDLYAHPVAKGHLAYSHDDAVPVEGIGCHNPAAVNIFRELRILLHHFFIFGNIVLVRLDAEPNQLISCLLQFRRNDILFRSHIHCK